MTLKVLYTSLLNDDIEVNSLCLVIEVDTKSILFQYIYIFKQIY